MVSTAMTPTTAMSANALSFTLRRRSALIRIERQRLLQELAGLGGQGDVLAVLVGERELDPDPVGEAAGRLLRALGGPRVLPVVVAPVEVGEPELGHAGKQDLRVGGDGVPAVVGLAAGLAADDVRPAGVGAAGRAIVGDDRLVRLVGVGVQASVGERG